MAVATEFSIRKVQETKKEGSEIEWDPSASGLCGWYMSLVKRLITEVRLNAEKTRYVCRI
jgi:hypothetical protein